MEGRREALPLTEIGNEVSSLRTVTGKLFELDPKLGHGQYGLEARTGPIHYKEAYKDTDPWLDLDESYCEPGEIKGVGKVLIYPKMPNIVTVFRDICGYQIQSRSNPDHVAKVELVSIDGQPVTSWLDTQDLKTYARVHPYRVGIWKDFSQARTAKASTMRWRVTELGNSGKDSHPFFFRENPEAFSTADLDGLIDRESAKVPIQTERTRIDDHSWHWDELVPASAKLVDTDWQIEGGGDDGRWNTNNFYSSDKYVWVGNYNSSIHYSAWFRHSNITIDKGSTITGAVVAGVSYSTYGSAANALFYCNAADNASAPTSIADYNSKSLTDNYIIWTKSGTYYGGSNVPFSNNFIAPVQEVISRPGWVSGNALMLMSKCYDCTNERCVAIRSYEYGSGSSLKTTLTWTEPTRRGPHIYVPNVSWLAKSLLKRREI